MPLTIPTTLYPVFESSLLAGKESAIGTAPTAFTGIPAAPFQPSNKVTWLEDQNLRGSNVKTYQLGQGPIWAEHSIPASPAYGDTIGIPLLGLLGDYTTTGTAGSPSWTASSAITAGAGPIAVTSASSAVAGTFIQIDTGTNAEVVTVGTGSTATSIVISAATPIRFAHLTGVAIVTSVAPFTHTFSNLNMSSSTGSTSAQPPTYTLLHRNGIAGSGAYNADQFVYTRFSEVKFSGKAEGWLTWEGKATSYSQTAPSANYTPSFSTVKGWPAWNSTASLASSSIFNISDISFTITRELDVVTTADGSQNPYVIAAGPLSATFTVDYDVVANENALNYMLNNTQPTLAWTITNGLSGANTVSMTVNAALMAHKDAPLTALKTQWGYKTSGEFMASTSNSGNSGGYSPLSIVLVNSVPTF